MADKLIYGCVESGTYSTSAPNPHVQLAGAASGFGIRQAFVDALADGETATVTIRASQDIWAVYSGAVFVTGSPNRIELSTATVLESSGALVNSASVVAFALGPDQRQFPALFTPTIASNELVLDLQGLRDTYHRVTLTEDITDGGITIVNSPVGGVIKTLVEFRQNPLVGQDIGTTLPGSTSISGGIVTIKGNGSNIWGTSDGFHFAYRPLSGNGSIFARVVSLVNTDDVAKAGVMIRQNLSDNARFAYTCIYPRLEGGIRFVRRASVGADTVNTAVNNVTIPQWLRLDRVGNTFTSYYSADGVSWTQVASAAVGMTSETLIGLAVTSRNVEALTTAVFDNVSVLKDVPVTAWSGVPGVVFDTPYQTPVWQDETPTIVTLSSLDGGNSWRAGCNAEMAVFTSSGGGSVEIVAPSLAGDGLSAVSLDLSCFAPAVSALV
jgi:regulation of enolase protein 1 (concanavalin A-like superfamily)